MSMGKIFLGYEKVLFPISTNNYYRYTMLDDDLVKIGIRYEDLYFNTSYL